MAIEIERKFLVANDGWRATASAGVRYLQGYLAKSPSATVRIRCAGAEATLTVKSPRRGLTRDEYSYSIPLADAEEMLRRRCGRHVLEKMRHLVEHEGMIWQVDVYLGAAAPLVVAEIELEREDQAFAVPAWLGREVSHSVGYHNSSIAMWAAAGPPEAEPRIRKGGRPAAMRVLAAG
jgi:adenylate cyclase